MPWRLLVGSLFGLGLEDRLAETCRRAGWLWERKGQRNRSIWYHASTFEKRGLVAVRCGAVWCCGWKAVEAGGEATVWCGSCRARLAARTKYQRSTSGCIMVFEPRPARGLYCIAH